MDSLLKAAIATDIDSDAVAKITEGKCNVLLYRDLKNYRDLGAALSPYGAAIILYETTKPGEGHWCALIRQNPTQIEFFDPYGLYPDSEFKFIQNPSELKEKPLLSELIAGVKEDMVYNHCGMQVSSPDVATCGRWCAVRVRKRGMPLGAFQKLFMDQKSGSPDELVTLMTLLFI